MTLVIPGLFLHHHHVLNILKKHFWFETNLANISIYASNLDISIELAQLLSVFVEHCTLMFLLLFYPFSLS